jgi:hypothetical protein
MVDAIDASYTINSCVSLRCSVYFALPAGQPRTDVEARIAANKSKLAELDKAIASLEADLANAIKGLGPELTAAQLAGGEGSRRFRAWTTSAKGRGAAIRMN